MGHSKHPQRYHLISISNIYPRIHSKSTELGTHTQKRFRFLSPRSRGNESRFRKNSFMESFCFSFPFFLFETQRTGTRNQNPTQTQRDKHIPFPWSWLQNRTFFSSWTRSLTLVQTHQQLWGRAIPIRRHTALQRILCRTGTPGKDSV